MKINYGIVFAFFLSGSVAASEMVVDVQVLPLKWSCHNSGGNIDIVPREPNGIDGTPLSTVIVNGWVVRSLYFSKDKGQLDSWGLSLKNTPWRLQIDRRSTTGLLVMMGGTSGISYSCEADESSSHLHI